MNLSYIQDPRRMRSIFRVKFDRIPADEVEHLHGDTMNEMIPLTVANTLNQTMKNRIEAKPNQSLRQVIRNQNLAPKESLMCTIKMER